MRRLQQIKCNIREARKKHLRRVDANHERFASIPEVEKSGELEYQNCIFGIPKFKVLFITPIYRGIFGELAGAISTVSSLLWQPRIQPQWSLKPTQHHGPAPVTASLQHLTLNIFTQDYKENAAVAQHHFLQLHDIKLPGTCEIINFGITCRPQAQLKKV